MSVISLSRLVVLALTLTPEAELRLMHQLSFGPPPVAVAPSQECFEPSSLEEGDATASSIALWIAYFRGPGAALWDRWRSRFAAYRALIETELQAHNLPADLFALAVIESGLDPNVTSRIGARGLWQLMPATARALGLRVDEHVDERTSPAISTAAAASLLVHLKARLNKWSLVLAAYNAGEGAVTTAGGTWAEVQPSLPSETRHFVPKVLAAARLLRGPCR